MPDMPSFEILRNGWFLHDLAGSMGVCYVALSGLAARLQPFASKR